MGGRSQAVLPAKQRAVKDLLPREVLEHAFLYLNRSDVEALQISHRYLHDITSAEGVGKVTPLRRLGTVDLINDNLVLRRKSERKKFPYDSEDAVRWLRNTCVEYLHIRASCLDQERGERALRWFVAHRSEFRIINISVELPLVSDALLQGFLQPDPAHHWKSAYFGGAMRGSLTLTSSSLENVKSIYVHSAHLQVTVDDVICWLHRPYPPSIGTECRQLTLASGNIDGEFQRLVETVREKFMTATTSRAFGVSIACRPRDVLPAAAFRKYNRHAGDLMSIEVIEGGRFSGNEVIIRRRPFP